MKAPWTEGFWPEAVWILMTNLSLLVAFVAFLSALGFLWHHGPRLLIKYGPEWLTRLGLRWEKRRA